VDAREVHSRNNDVDSCAQFGPTRILRGVLLDAEMVLLVGERAQLGAAESVNRSVYVLRSNSHLMDGNAGAQRKGAAGAGLLEQLDPK